MKSSDFNRVLGDSEAREANYAELVPEYYDRITKRMRSSWGDSFHFAIFQGDESLAEAIHATECMLTDKAGFQAGMRVLDVGCGVGGPALTIAEHSGAHVTGVNITPDHIEIARERALERGLADQTEFLVADGMSLPFEDESFDGAYMMEAGCHMPDKARFYRELGRVLKPGAVFTGTDWFEADGITDEDRAQYIEPICRYHAVPHLTSPAQIAGYLDDAGLDVDVVCDTAEMGGVLRNWEVLDSKILQNTRGFVLRLLPSNLRMMAQGGFALLDGTRQGAFQIGYWRARKRLPS